MEIRVLRYFLTVVREESITKAAEALHITQPTLSRQLAQMEEEMGVRLFDRGTRKIVLTNEGILPLSPDLTANSVLAWKRQQSFSTAATKFIQHVKEQI